MTCVSVYHLNNPVWRGVSGSRNQHTALPYSQGTSKVFFHQI